uniref:Uncharacterized protein n=1 Tax=Anguilla anguilla TaxID=7936 RepID=A0A0E9TYP9_ANGAN
MGTTYVRSASDTTLGSKVTGITS